ncbi:hypothetical protein ACOME3_002598 [Neoechinorhynchus agilis]
MEETEQQPVEQTVVENQRRGALRSAQQANLDQTVVGLRRAKRAVFDVHNKFNNESSLKFGTASVMTSNVCLPVPYQSIERRPTFFRTWRTGPRNYMPVLHRRQATGNFYWRYGVKALVEMGIGRTVVREQLVQLSSVELKTSHINLPAFGDLSVLRFGRGSGFGRGFLWIRSYIDYIHWLFLMFPILMLTHVRAVFICTSNIGCVKSISISLVLCTEIPTDIESPRTWPSLGEEDKTDQPSAPKSLESSENKTERWEKRASKDRKRTAIWKVPKNDRILICLRLWRAFKY